MRLEGWNSIPDGYGAWFDIGRAPLWLRLWFHTPFLDRYAYPVAVRRGFGHLVPVPGQALDGVRKFEAGWQVGAGRDGAVREDALRSYPIDDPHALRGRRRRYARIAQLHHLRRGLSLPPVIQLPNDRAVERHIFLFWRIRIPLSAALAVAGGSIAGWPGVVLGLATAFIAEVLFSYRRQRRATGTASPA